MALVDACDVVLLDLDGTVWSGGSALPNAVESIGKLAVPVVYITNNAFRGPGTVADLLNGMGIDAAAGDVLTSAQAAIAMAREKLGPGERLLVVGSDSFKDLARDAGFDVVGSADEDPKAVLQGHSPETGWHELSEAALAIGRGTSYYASNLDTSLPTERGLMVGNGAMVAAVTAATGVTPAAAGKPEPAMFTQATRGAGAERPVAVGDRLDTDIAGAVAAGIPSLHVLTGVSGPLALLEAPKEQRPAFIGEDLSALFLDAAELAPGPQGGFTARVDRGNIILGRGTAESTPVQALRTALEVAWHMPEPPELVRPDSDAAEKACAGWW